MWSVLPGTLLATVIGSAVYLFSKWVGFWERRNKMISDKKNTAEMRYAIEQKDKPGTFRSGLLKDCEEPVERCFPDVSTLYEAFLRGLKVSNNGQCIGYRPGVKQPYNFLTYEEVFRNARYFGSALVGKLGLKAGNETHIGIYAKNCPEWFMSALACVQHSVVIVPLYDTLGADAASFIAQQTEQKVIVVDTVSKARTLLECGQLNALKHIVVIEEGDTSLLEEVNHNVEVHLFKTLLKEGEQNPMPLTIPKPDDTYIICYTSGTTGLPKGVMLTHKNIIANFSALYLMLDKFDPEAIAPNQVLISYLPLSHMMEQMCHWCMFAMGSSIGYYSGNIQKLSDDMIALKPTIFPVVPRLLNRFYDLIQSNLQKAGPLGKAVYHLAYQRKLALLKKGIARNDTIWDKLVFSKVQAMAGGRVRLMATGSAPLSAEVLETCRVAFGATIIEAYGQTECTALATTTWPGEHVGGHCGGPATCSLVKLADVPDLNYYASEGKGEVMIKGPHVTKGYYKDEAKTAELFDEEGFLHTGDIGQLLPTGAIKIIDRKKHIFKLAQGEYVAPEKIENVYIRAPCVQQVFVDGNSLERYLVAIVVPEESEIVRWFHENVEKNGKSYKDMLRTKEVRNYILSELQAIGKQNKLNSIEQVKAVYVTAEPFTVENELLTPTLKAKRPQLRKFYADVIAQLYNDNGQ